MSRRILILMSDTGGGHRAAAEAIRDALHIRYGQESVAVKLVDVFREYSPVPLKFAPEFYPWWVNRSKTSWGVGYNMSNTRRRAQLLSQTMYVTIEGGLKRMLRENPADVVVCVHSLLTRPAIQALTWFTQRPPFVVVVTDLVSTHHLWYDKRCERCLVPTQPAYERGLAAGLSPEQLRNTGLPVHPRFALGLKSKEEARGELGWDLNLPAVLVVGGGEGMGPIYRTARAIDERGLRCQLIVVAGNNKALKDKLESKTWNQPTRIYGFRKDMPLLMAATDILVTKAGPATISEACIAGVPMILYDAIPGQETGNINYVVDNRAGVYAATPAEVGAALTSWLHRGPDFLRQMSESARALGRPNAVFEIADEVWAYAYHPPIRAGRRTLWADITETARELTEGLL